MKQQPTVSIVMATYNGERFIREQIDSIVNQSYPIHELIIQDDGSTDNTIDILRQYELQYPFVHIYENKQNLGYKENFRTAALRASGDFIGLADQDDIWFTNKIEEQVKAIGNHDVCYSQHTRGKDMEHAHIVDYKCAPERQMFAAIVGHSLLMTREYAQDERNWLGYMAHDIGLSVFAHFRKGIVHIEKPLNWHRSHDDSVSTKVHLDLFNDNSRKPTWQPYVYGYRNYRTQQRKENWQKFYGRLLEESANGVNPLVNKMCRLMLSKSPVSLLRLCMICLKHRSTIYPDKKTSGIKGMIRGFFFPFIHCYNCTFYDS